MIRHTGVIHPQDHLCHRYHSKVPPPPRANCRLHRAAVLAHEPRGHRSLLGPEGPTVRNRTVRNRISGRISPSTCARRWIGHQKLNSAAIMREIMAGMWDFPCFGPARAHLSRSNRAPIAGDHNAGNTDTSGRTAVACRIVEQPAVPTSSLTRSRVQSPCWFPDLTFERSTAAREPAQG